MSESGAYERIQDEHFQILPHSTYDDVTINIYGYQNCKQRKLLFNFISLLLLGIPYMMCIWYPNLNIKKCKKSSLKTADLILAVCEGNSTISPVDSETNDNNKELKYFVYQYCRYVWTPEANCYKSVSYMDNLLLSQLIEINGHTKDDRNYMMNVFGPNKITVEVKSYLQLFIDEIFNPFYIFQIFSITLWSFDDYYIYAGCIFFLSFVSISTSLYETKRQSLALYNLVNSTKCDSIEIYNKSSTLNVDQKAELEIISVDPDSLVPGDLIIIPANGCIMPCDAVLLTGSCIVNESMLTGESVPVTKTPPNSSSEKYNLDIHKRHTLFAGTHVIQTRYYSKNTVCAKVIRTGFDTSKGELVKSILYPKPIGFQFYQDSIKFVLILSIVACAGMGYTIYLYLQRHVEVMVIVIRALDIITVIVPPALPAAMTVGTIYSQSRLRKRNIFCISPPRINICGKLKLVCFDKTGTLTHDGLEFYGVLPCANQQFDSLAQIVSELDQKSVIVQAMVTCHSITRIDGQLSGDPLDLSMFEATNWELHEPGEENSRFDMLVPTVVKPATSNSTIFNEFELPYEIGILRQFSFSSNEQCMSVICRVLGSRNMIIITKGAPEKIEKLCRPESIPTDLSTVLSNFTTSGFRVIAIAYKELPSKLKWKEVQKFERDKVECDLNFLGLIIMQNALKQETTPIIHELHIAKIRTVMVTGDNTMTAIAVSRDCGMILPNESILSLSLQSANADWETPIVPKIMVQILGSEDKSCCILNIDNPPRNHIAIDGKTWSVIHEHYPSIVPLVIGCGTIFARFSPEQKTQLVVALQELDYIVAMCGDGANDCGALKAAHIGVSLSQAEASVAAPFTSTVQDISCMKHLMLEGRCALVTSFAVFKYMAIYSIIQFFSILILYRKSSTLGDWQFLYIDLVIITSLAITIGQQGPADVLVPKRPTGSLISLMNLIPLLLQILLCWLMQYGSLYYLSLQPWYTVTNLDPNHGEEIVLCWENTIIFAVSSYQYIILACVYSKGWPYRQSVMTNGYLMMCAVMLMLFTTLLLIYPVEPLAKYFDMIPCSPTYHQFLFRLKVVLFPFVHLCLAVFIECCIADCVWLKKLCHFLTRKKSPKNKYKLYNHSLDVLHSLNN